MAPAPLLKSIPAPYVAWPTDHGTTCESCLPQCLPPSTQTLLKLLIMVTVFALEPFAWPRTVTPRKSTVALAIDLTVIPFSQVPSCMLTTLGYKLRHREGATLIIEPMSRPWAIAPTIEFPLPARTANPPHT